MLSTITPLTLAEAVASHVPEPDYILGPLQPGDIGILSGADGAGKSLVALAMAASVAYAVPAAGVVDAPGHAGRALYIAGEDRRADHIRRLQRLAQHLRQEHGIGGDDDGMLTVWPLEGRRLPLVVPAGDGYAVTPLGEQLADALAGYRLAILDPLRMMHDCQESDGPGMDYLACWLVTVAMRNRQAILLVHHVSQSAMLEGRTDHHAGRGATDLPAACRGAWTLRGMTQPESQKCGIDEDERRDWRVLVNSKASHAVENGPRWLQLRGEAVKTPWGAVRITGRLGQQHADVLEAICYEREKKGELEDGRIKLLVDPARVRRRAGQTSGMRFAEVLKELEAAVIEIIEPEHFACSGHLIDHIDKARRADGSYITRENPLSGGERHLWRVEIGKALCTLVADDIWIGYDPAGIARLNHGVSQAVARHVLSHKTQPRGGGALDPLIRAVAGGEQSEMQMRDRRREIRADADALRAIGVEIDGDRVRVEQMPGAWSKCPALADT